MQLQNVPAWLYPCPTILLGLAARREAWPSDNENLSKLIWFENPELEKISLEQNVDVDHGQGQWSESEKGG